jgi:HAD superfamily hydrolase (TIGR01662 family)
LSGRHCAFDAVLFDLGGTLIYFAGDKEEIIVQADHALAHSLQSLGYDLDLERFLTDFEARLQIYFTQRDVDHVEYTTRRLLRELLYDHGYPAAREADLRTALQAMYEVFEACWLVEEDTIPVLQTLKDGGCRVGLISNAADDDDVLRQVQRAGLQPYLNAIFTSAASGWRKPHPRMFEEAMRALDCSSAQRILMVGDRLKADIAGAKKLGMQAAWITRRVPDADQRLAASECRPDVRVASLTELLHWMKDQSAG